MLLSFFCGFDRHLRDIQDGHRLKFSGKQIIYAKLVVDWNSNQIIRSRTISSGMRDTLVRETRRMTMNMGYRYRCRNSRCGCEIEVTRPSKEAARNPRCCCGAEMKRPYTKPSLKELDAQCAAFSGIYEKEETPRTR
jgi:hypothetical protein